MKKLSLTSQRWREGKEGRDINTTTETKSNEWVVSGYFVNVLEV